MVNSATMVASTLAALDPSQLLNGKPFWRVRESPTERTSSIFTSSMATILVQLRSEFLLSLEALRSPSTAHPKKSKPGPRLAMVVGAKALIEANTGLGPNVPNPFGNALYGAGSGWIGCFQIRAKQYK